MPITLVLLAVVALALIPHTKQWCTTDDAPVKEGNPFTK